MSDSNKSSPGVVLLGLAWIQFLTMAAVIDKPDMRNVSSAWNQGINSPFIWTWDWTKFGGLSIALVVMAVSFLTIPTLFAVFGSGNSEDRPIYLKPLLDTLVKIGFYAWLLSFLTFIGYLNSLSVIVLYGSLALILVIGLAFRLLYGRKS